MKSRARQYDHPFPGSRVEGTVAGKAGTSRRPLTRTQAESAIAAQRLACAVVLEGCERALFELRCALGRAEEPSEVRTGLLAAGLIEEVLLGWRETLAELGSHPSEPTPTAATQS